MPIKKGTTNVIPFLTLADYIRVCTQNLFSLSFFFLIDSNIVLTMTERITMITNTAIKTYFRVMLLN